VGRAEESPVRGHSWPGDAKSPAERETCPFLGAAPQPRVCTQQQVPREAEQEQSFKIQLIKLVFF